MLVSILFLVYLLVSYTLIYWVLLFFIVVSLVLGVRAWMLSKKMHSSIRCLVWCLFFVALTSIQFWLIFIEPPNFYPDIVIFFMPYQLLPAPFFLLFAIRFLKLDHKFLKWKFWLFAPFWIFMVVYMGMRWDVIVNELTYAVARKKYFPVFKIEEIATLVYGFILVFWCFRIVFRFERQNRDKKYDLVVSQTRWIKKILAMGVGLCVIWLLSLFFDLVSIYHWGNYAYLPAWFGFLFLIIYVSYSGFQPNSILHNPPDLSEEAEEIILKTELSEPEKGDSTIRKYFQKIEQMMLVGKKYLDPNLDLQLLAKEISISPNYLSKIINSHSHMRFSDYVNSYRVMHARHMLETETFKDYDMLSIALEAGFNSKSVFYAAFKKHTGQTPGAYRIQYEKKNES